MLDAGRESACVEPDAHRGNRQQVGSSPCPPSQLLAAGADPNLRDNRRRTPLNLCRKSLAEHEGVDGYREVEAILVPITDP